MSNRGLCRCVWITSGVAGLALLAASLWIVVLSNLWLRPQYQGEPGLPSPTGTRRGDLDLQGHHHDPGTDSGLAYEDVEFPANDGSTLRGWLVEAEAPGAVAVVGMHGGASDRRTYLNHLPSFREQGYDTLLFDQRGCGLSDGERRGLSVVVMLPRCRRKRA